MIHRSRSTDTEGTGASARMQRNSLPLLLFLAVLACSGPTEPATVATVTISPSDVTLASGAAITLHATLRDAVGTPIVGRSVSWTTSDGAIATVSTAGQVTANQNRDGAPRHVMITATTDGRSGSAEIHVAPDTNQFINDILSHIRTTLNDAFRLKFITNRVRAEYSVVNPSAWVGSFQLQPLATADSLIFPSYYAVPKDSIIAPMGRVTFGDHHTRWEYRVRSPSDTIARAEYIWIERNLMNHPIDTMVWRILQNKPYTWELESGLYFDSHIRVPSHVLTTLSPHWYGLTHLKGFDRIERFLSGPNSTYTYKNFATCFFQSLQDSLAYSFGPTAHADLLHELAGYWLIEYPTYKRPVAFQLRHVVSTASETIMRTDSVIVVNTNALETGAAFNFGAMGGEAGISIYTWLTAQGIPRYRVVVDRGEWTGTPSTTERIAVDDFDTKRRYAIVRPLSTRN